MTAADINSNSTERSRNLWAPWRMEYIDALDDGNDDCFLCRYSRQPELDESNLVIYRSRSSFVLMNRFPYTSGHLLVAPYDHVPNLHDLPPDALTELMTNLRDCQDILAEVLRPNGFNAGLNLGRCAGAGLPGHLHLHIVPRWEGDTNFMSVLGDVRVIPKSLESLCLTLREKARQMNIPRP